MPWSYRNQSIDLPNKSMDWFLYDHSIRHERVKCTLINSCLYKKDIECEVREIMGDRFNLLVKTFKQANPNLTQEKAPKTVKEYYDTIKNKSDVETLVREMEMSEWVETWRYTETSEKHITFFLETIKTFGINIKY